MSLSAQQKELLKSTSAVLKQHGTDIMSKFYQALFKEHPEFRNFFNETNQKTGKQPAAFAATLYYWAQNLDNIDVMIPQMARISSKHRATTVRPEHYPIVGKYLLQAIKDAFGDRATPELMAAWQALYDLIAKTFMDREKELYAQLGDDRDKNFVPFSITKKDVIASGPTHHLTLQRQDGGKLWGYHPGQYITIRVERNGVLHNGHYPLLEPFNGSTYSIAFKPGYDIDPNSVISDELINHRQVGGTVLVSPPAGTFGLVSEGSRHLFISGGIAITNFMAMIQELNQQGRTSSATVVQCVRTPGHAAFAEKLRGMLPQGQYKIVTQEDPLSKKHLEDLVHHDSQVYVSGSEVFLTMAENALAGFNHPRSQIHMRSIEPTLRLLKNIHHK
jgi:nitric oxide dioxygenase